LNPKKEKLKQNVDWISQRFSYAVFLSLVSRTGYADSRYIRVIWTIHTNTEMWMLLLFGFQKFQQRKRLSFKCSVFFHTQSANAESKLTVNICHSWPFSCLWQKRKFIHFEIEELCSFRFFVTNDLRGEGSWKEKNTKVCLTKRTHWLLNRHYDEWK
jgi:hypothetical protein